MDSEGPPPVRQVWRNNVSSELEIMTTYLQLSYRFVAIDTEFPGFLRPTRRDATEEERYHDLKFNVDRTHLIQLGVTLFDEAGETPWPGCHWQINFCNFRPNVDACSPDSIDFLLQTGHNLREYQRKGVSAPCFSRMLRNKIFNPHYKAKFITFHGLYDVAYVIKLITGAPLPETSIEFLLLARRLLGDFCDVKHMARFYPGLRGGKLGLKDISSIVLGDKKPPGMFHQAGYDSLLTGAVYQQMKMKYKMDEDDEERFSLILYGLEEGCKSSKMIEGIEATPVILPPPSHPLLPHPRPSSYPIYSLCSELHLDLHHSELTTAEGNSLVVVCQCATIATLHYSTVKLAPSTYCFF